MSNQNLRKQLVKLAYERKDLRPHLIPLLQKHAARDKYAFMKGADSGDVDNFVEEMGDKEVSNPNPDSKDTHPKVKVKSLPNSDEGKGMFKKLFESWKDKLTPSTDEEKEKKNLDKNIKRLKKQKDKASKQELWQFATEVTDIAGSKGKWKKLDKEDRKKVLEDIYEDAVEDVTKRYFDHNNKPEKKPSSKDIAEFWSKSNSGMEKVDKYIEKYQKKKKDKKKDD